MIRIARAAFLVLTFLSLQLSLFGGGAECSVAGIFAAMRGATTTSAMPVAARQRPGGGLRGAEQVDRQSANMQMTAMQMADMPSPHNDQSCTAEHVNVGCNAMAVCVFAAVTSQRLSQSIQAPLSARAPTLAVRTPPTEGVAPDSPPPRA